MQSELSYFWYTGFCRYHKSATSQLVEHLEIFLKKYSKYHRCWYLTKFTYQTVTERSNKIAYTQHI